MAIDPKAVQQLCYGGPMHERVEITRKKYKRNIDNKPEQKSTNHMCFSKLCNNINL